jgi:hypothetical protein
MEHFRVDVGEVSLIGVAPLSQDRTCVSGRTCVIDGVLGHQLTTSDRITILDTCGAHNYIFRASDHGEAELFSVGSRVTFNNVISTAAGGQYRLCWCYGGLQSNGGSWSCSTAEDFKVDFGKLDIRGPSPRSQHRTCVSGQRCALDGFTGHGLSSKDQIVVLDTCGARNAPPRFSQYGFALSLTSSGSIATWGGMVAGAVVYDVNATDVNATIGAIVTAAGGRYRLCWCEGVSPGHNTCSAVDAFEFDMGQLTLIGVSPLSQDRTCVSGQVCSVDGVIGESLSIGDRFLILDTCGVHGAMQPRWALSGHFGSTSQSGASVSWGSTAVTAAGGQYRLCWCSGTFLCSVGEDFRTDAGTFTLVGPSPLSQDRTCVSGQTCSFDGITGQHLSPTDRALLLDTCAVDGAPQRLQDRELFHPLQLVVLLSNGVVLQCQLLVDNIGCVGVKDPTILAVTHGSSKQTSVVSR